MNQLSPAEHLALDFNHPPQLPTVARAGANFLCRHSKMILGSSSPPGSKKEPKVVDKNAL